jgi:esterase/lipase superfamily enzyme
VAITIKAHKDDRGERAVQYLARGYSVSEVATCCGFSTVDECRRSIRQAYKVDALPDKQRVLLEHKRIDMVLKALADEIEAGNLEAVALWMKAIDTRTKLFNATKKEANRKIDVLAALDVLVRNNVLPNSVAARAHLELERATIAISSSLGLPGDCE